MLSAAYYFSGEMRDLIIPVLLRNGWLSVSNNQKTVEEYANEWKGMTLKSTQPRVIRQTTN